MPSPVPAALDYDMWLGPASFAPYAPNRVHSNWRWNLDYGGGQLMDWIGHHLDIANWALDLDSTGPVTVEAQGTYIKNSIWNSADKFRVYLEYPGNINIVIAGGYEDIKQGIKWIGSDGWFFVSRTEMNSSVARLLDLEKPPGQIKLFRSPGHQRNFLDCVRSRTEPLTPSETALRSVTPGYLAMISMRLGRKIRFNPVSQKIIDDSAASGMLGRAMRSPWHL
jgi:predicted dehydrogenase